MFIPDPGSESVHTGSRIQGQKVPVSRIRISEIKYFYPQRCFEALGNMIRDVHPGGQRSTKNTAGS